MRKLMPQLSLILFLLASFIPNQALAATLSAAEVRAEMLDKTIVTRKFGMKIRMRYSPGGVVTTKALLGSLEGTWRPRGNQICTTFPSGPAKGTSCVSFTRIGPNRFKSSEGVYFRVVN
jgi:hypothetical protein